jgi:SAM-dependent methyltransferase
VFYGPEQAAIHDVRFGDLARQAARLVLGELQGAGITDGTVVDLGCGTGIFAEIVSDAGYDVEGVDLSPAMLELARKRAPKAHFMEGSLHDVDLPDAVAVVVLGDVVNYATDPRAGLDALSALAVRVRAVLAGGGVFAFDSCGPGRGGGPGGSRDRVHQGDGWTLAMHSWETNDTLTREITIFTADGDHYRRVDETHVLRLYDPAEVGDLLQRAGFRYIEMRAGYDTPADLPGWTVFVCR